MPTWKRTDNWIAGIAEDGINTYHVIYPIADLTVEKVQASLDAVCGPGRCSVTAHGTAISVFDHAGRLASLEKYLKNAEDTNRSKDYQESLREKIKELKQKLPSQYLAQKGQN